MGALTETESPWADWVEANTKRELTPFEKVAVRVLCLGFGRPWNVPWNWGRTDWHCGGCVSVCARSTLATYDRDGLTRLVIAAHDYCVRVEISPAMSYLRIRVHPRSREKLIMSGHPTIEEAIAKFRGVKSVEVA